MQFLYHFIVAALVFSVIDLTWLGLVANSVYRKLMVGLIRKKPLLVPAILFYVVYIIGLVVFAVQPALNIGSLWDSVWRGALFGFVCYATYDLTNLSTLKNWSAKLTAIDMTWGTVLSGLISMITYMFFH
jgi:uncharacterized membrane protein